MPDDEFRDDHASDDSCKDELADIGKFVDGELDEPAASRIARHVDECRSCGETLDTLRRLRSLNRDSAAVLPEVRSVDPRRLFESVVLNLIEEKMEQLREHSAKDDNRRRIAIRRRLVLELEDLTRLTAPNNPQVQQVRLWLSQFARSGDAHHVSLADSSTLSSASELALPHKSILVREAVERVEALNPELMLHLQRHRGDLDKVPWPVFEHLVGEILAANGFSDVRLVGRDSTTTADIYAVHPVGIDEQVRFYVEVKRTRDKVGIGVINTVVGAMAIERHDHGWDVGMIVSLGGISTVKRSSILGVRLRDRGDIDQWLTGYRLTSSGLWLPDPGRHMPNPSR